MQNTFTLSLRFTRPSLSALLLIACSIGIHAQVKLSNAGSTALLDFSNSMPISVGSNPSTAFSGAGYEPNTVTAGRLNSNAWAVTGWSDGSLAFGATRTTAATDYTRGSAAAAVTTGGMYAYTGAPHSVANPALMIQPGGSDFAPGTLTLKIENTGTSNITQLVVSYNLYNRNDQARGNSFNFAYSPDDATYTPVPALDFTSPAAADANGWVLIGNKMTTISGLSVAPGAFYYIRWNSADVNGSGSRDEFGLDDISLTATFVSSCMLTDAGLTGVHCEDNNETPSNPTDDFIWFQLNPMGNNLGSGYNVTVNPGSVLLNGTASATNVPYGSSQFFRLQQGSAGSGNVNISIADVNNPNCTFDVTLIDPGSCSAASSCSTSSGLSDIACNNNSTIPNATDDYITFYLNPSGSFTATYSVFAFSGTVTLMNGDPATGVTYGVQTQFRLQNGSAGGGNVFIYLQDDNNQSCVLFELITDPGSCSSPSCSFSVTCPPSPTGIYDCNNPIPPPVTTEAGFEALGGDISGTFCGTLAITSVTATINNCSSTSISRTYTIFDDLPPLNGIQDANEVGFTCTLTYVYSPDMTAPVFNPNPPLPANTTISCTAPLPLAPTLNGTDNCGAGMVPPVIFINEFHYDNVGTDQGEFIEVAGTAGINLSDYQLYLYNGNGGVVYAPTITLSGVIDNEGSGFGAVSFAYASNGIQNGSPDGIALYRISTNQVIQFLSYEGVFQATDGPAMGMFSTDVGVQELGTEPIGLSLQLTGTGQVASDFTWVGPIAQSPGTLNAGQTINPLPASIPAAFMQTEVPGPCAGSRIVTRKWTLSDNCNNQNTHTQVITVSDTDPPVLTPTPANITIACNAPVPPVPVVVGTDACDPAGIINGPVWINEIHYDNAGTDANEFIEIAGRAGTNLGTGYELFLYNGSTGNMGGTYLSVPLSGIIPDQSNGFGTIAFFIPGIENGPSDGIAFVKGATVLQFLSYEGVMTAVGGPANGMVSTDIGVSETGSEPNGQSLRLSGNGTTYANFTWNGPSAANPATPDAVNQGQTFPAQPPVGLPVTFTQTTMPGACAQAQIIKRTWTTTDACGNTAVYTQTINLSDNAGPTIVCNSITVNLDIFGNAVVTQAQLIQSVSDNCSPGSGITVTPPGPFTFTCLNQGTTQSIMLTATDQCGNTSACTAQVTVNPFDRCTPKILISEPCVCKNNATTLFNGQFGETIKIESLAGQTWSVTAVSGLYLSSSLPPPSAPTLVPIGTLFVQNPNNSGDYYFTGIHVDAIGYSITVQNNLGQTVTIGNSCQYPNPAITADLNGPLCLYSNPVPLTGTPGDANIVSQGFTVNGVPATVFDPGQGVGQYIIVYTVDGGVPKAFGPNDPGCIQTITVYVNVLATPTNIVCNDLVYLSLDADCTEAILPDDILEGTYGCYDDYIVEIDRTLPFGNGPWEPGIVNANDIGKTYQVRVTHLVSGNKCWGNIKIEDKISPALSCTNFSVPCNTSDLSANYLFNALNINAALPTAVDCQPVTLSYADSEIPKDCASGLTKIITRKWTAVDASGNSSTCNQTISLLRSTLTDLKFPPNYDGIQAPGFSCTAAYPTPAWIESQGLQGYPWVFGKPEDCNFNWVFHDDLIPVCDGTYKINRRWTVLNACAPGVIHHDQLIYVEDKQGPVMTCPPNTTVSVDPFQCCATVDLPNLIIKDECSRVNNIGGMVVTFDPYTGQQTGMYTFGGTLQDFPGNNWWDRDTLAAFGYTPCLPVGTQTVTYIAEDDCGNSKSCTFKLTIQDLVPPVAACDQFTTVALADDGKAAVNASTFDDGSYDICCLKDFTVGRGANFGSTVSFNCNDVGHIIMVTFRVTDCNGNTNDCMVQVEVQDKIKPSCLPPAQVTVNCENFDPSLWVYGIAAVDDNCCLDNTKVYQGQEGLTHTASYTLFDTVCNKGTITRTFRAFDCHGQSSQCTQRVFVNYEQDYFLKFPNDVIVTVCNDSARYDEPKFFGEDCELLGISYEDEIFSVVPDACFKIERTWTIINWCTYNPNLPCIYVDNPNPNPIANAAANLPGPTVSAPGTLPPWAPTVVKINPTDTQAKNYSDYWQKNANCYKYKQIIKIIDGVAPTGTYTVPTCANQTWTTPNSNLLWNESYWWDNGIGTHDLCEEPTDLCITGTDACSGSNVNIEYLLFLDLDGDGLMETVVNSVNTGISGLGWNNVLYNNLNTLNFAGGTPREFDERQVAANQKYGFTIQEIVAGNHKTACVRWNTQQQQNTFVVPELPYGTHKIKWFITDGCGNNKEYEYAFTVKDCKAPTVVCLNGLSVNIMPTGMIQLWASDFLQYAEDNCTPSGQLKVGIRKCGTGTGFPLDGNGNPITSVTFNCTELGTQCVELWAMDAAGNADYCETYVIVQDNLGNCTPTDHINVAGAVVTEMTDGVEEAMVRINGTSSFTPPYSFFDLSDADGTYQIMNNVPLDATFTITPEKNDNQLNGVTTYDLVLISKHILGIESLDSPYKIIAADANKSNSVTTFDIVELRKLILGIYTELPDNNSWRFVDHSFSFPNPNNPFETAFPESISVADAMSNQMSEDFMAIKIGDVNNSVAANATMQAEERSKGTALFDIEDRDVKAGETFEVSFKAAQALQGFQFTMTLNGLEMVGLTESEHVSTSNFGTFSNAVTVSVDGAQSFTLRFRAAKTGRLSEMLGVSGSITRAEAYLSTNASSETGHPDAVVSKLGIAFRFDGKTIAGLGFELYQNQPNPFVNKTSIGFFLPEATEAKLSVFDETGREVYQQKGQFPKGENSILLDRALLNTSGILYYKLETATDRATKKMIQSK